MRQRELLKEQERISELMGSLPCPSDDPAATDAQLRELSSRLTHDLHPVRPIRPPLVYLGGFLLIFAALVVLSTLLIPALGWQILMPMQRATVFATLAAAAALLAFSLLRQMIPGSGVTAPGRTIAVATVMLCLACAAIFQGRGEPAFVAKGVACMKTGTPFALPAALLFFLLLRRGAVLSPRQTSATAGALAGLVSTGVLEFHCPDLNLWHILVWHVGISVLGACLAVLISITAEKLRDRRP